jgi:hypothetical protein
MRSARVGSVEKQTGYVVESEEAIPLGGDDAFIHAWGRMQGALVSTRRQLWAVMGLATVLAGSVAYLAWRNEHKETYVFVRNHLGEVVQAEPNAFLHAGDARTEGEVEYFIRELIEDGWTWTPLDINDRLKAFDEKILADARPGLREGLRLGERRSHVDGRMSGKIYDEVEGDKAPQILIMRQQPLFEVQVTFQRYLIDERGAVVPAPTTVLRVLLKTVPRGPRNRYGFIVVEGQVSQRL